MIEKKGDFLITICNKLRKTNPAVCSDEDLPCICCKCGSEMQIVRPGKYQCIKCEESERLYDILDLVYLDVCKICKNRNREDVDNCEHIYSCVYKDFSNFEHEE